MEVVFFDLETTGLDICNDRIVEIYARRVNNADTSFAELHLFLNPTIAIPQEAINVHRITNEQVANCPTFKDKSEEIFKFFDGAYIAGFNSNGYDVPMLIEEFKRAGIDFAVDKKHLLDMHKVEHALWSHSLIESYKRYYGKDYAETIGQAHGAKADVIATIAVFYAQLNKVNFPKFEVSFTDETAEAYRQLGKPNDSIADLTGRLVYDAEGQVCYNFGKNKGKKVLDDVSYAQWMLGQSFPSMTKAILSDLLYPKKEEVHDEQVAEPAVEPANDAETTEEAPAPEPASVRGRRK